MDNSLICSCGNNAWIINDRGIRCTICKRQISFDSMIQTLMEIMHQERKEVLEEEVRSVGTKEEDKK